MEEKEKKEFLDLFMEWFMAQYSEGTNQHPDENMVLLLKFMTWFNGLTFEQVVWNQCREVEYFLKELRDGTKNS